MISLRLQLVVRRIAFINQKVNIIMKVKGFIVIVIKVFDNYMNHSNRIHLNQIIYLHL